MSTLPKATTINIRTSQVDLDLIDRAAAQSGKTRTDFMLEASRRLAKDVLLDQVIFPLDDAAYQAFTDLLDNPAPSTGALRRLLAAPPPWE